MEEYRDQPTHAEKIFYQQKLLQEDVVRIRAGISQVSTVRANASALDIKVTTAASPTCSLNLLCTTCPSFYKVILVVSSCKVQDVIFCFFFFFWGCGLETRCSLLFFPGCFLIFCNWHSVSGWLWLSRWVIGDKPSRLVLCFHVWFCRRWRMRGMSISSWREMWTGWSQPCRDRWIAAIFLRLWLWKYTPAVVHFNTQAWIRTSCKWLISDETRKLILSWYLVKDHSLVSI